MNTYLVLDTDEKPGENVVYTFTANKLPPESVLAALQNGGLYVAVADTFPAYPDDDKAAR